MKLYQHSAHCSTVIQWFLDENPEYWPFVPNLKQKDFMKEDTSNISK